MNRATKVKTPFRYPGGKYYALKYILPFIEQIHHQEYREPFIGGGSVFFGKSKAQYNWINDIYDELINIYLIIQDSSQFPFFKEMLTKEKATRKRYSEIKTFQPKSNLESAFKYYYLNRTSFSGKLISPAWGYREKRSIPPSRWPEVLDPAHEKLQNVTITAMDFEKVIIAPSKCQSVLLYLDPPYFIPPKTKHYSNGFSNQDHFRLAQCLRKTKYSFLLSYEDCPEIRKIYSWAHIYNLSFPYRVGDSTTVGNKRSLGNEIIVTNRLLTKQEQLRIL